VVPWLRLRATGPERFWFNHGSKAVETPAGRLPAAGVLRQGLCTRLLLRGGPLG
jgi:hypothetical protein